MSNQRSQGRRQEAIFEGTCYPLKCFQNAWFDGFFIHRDLTGKDNVPAIDTKKNLGSIEGNLESFLQTGDSSSPCEADEVIRYCDGGLKLHAVENGTGEAGIRRAAWVDDRNSPHLTGMGNVRLCGKWLTATGLWRYLRQPQYKLENQPDAERRLIYISDLTPEMIHALADTAPALQVPALRDAISKHVSFRSSIRVQSPSDGFPSFQLEFHLPFFALRKVTQSESTTPTICGTPLRNRENLNLLTRDKIGPEGQESFLLHEAQISCVLHGFDEWQWITYCFEDAQHEDEGDEVVDRELDEEVTFGEEDEDPISCRLVHLDTQHPIWRPRQYFLKSFETKIKKFWDEWHALVHRLEIDRSEYIRLHPFASAKNSGYPTGTAEEMSTAFHWTRQRMDLVTKLLCMLSGTIHEWHAFISPDGDVGYFSDLDVFPSNSQEFRRYEHAGQSLRSIKQTFGKLEKDQQKLVSLKESLARDFSMLKILLSLEGNAATENSAFIARFTTWVLYPFFLAAGMFSMQPTVIPFELKFRSFVFSMLMLTLAMFVIQYLMKRWTMWKNQIILLLKMEELEEQKEGEQTLSLRSELPNEDIPGSSV
ncbi:hypothetical protein N431DRAFT_417671 [Stipitochalara longipes BDJ]|nr:hypothetical protein N431DRAFT_417671 [Stipitochalara longipes BDJ]